MAAFTIDHSFIKLKKSKPFLRTLSQKKQTPFPLMATLSIGHSFRTKKSLIFDNKKVVSRTLVIVSCQTRLPFDPSSPETKKKKKKKETKGRMIVKMFMGMERLGRGLKDSLSPKQKGDWKDLVLMSLSFAVYVYISQKIVCAYCAWMSLVKHPL